MKKILEYNFYLAKWFAGNKQDKIIPGTVFLFLNQISFLFLAFSLVVNHFVLDKIPAKVFTMIVMGVVLIIMYGFQKPVHNYIQKHNYTKDLVSLSNEDIYFKRLLAIIFFIIPFLSCFIIAILFYR